VGILLHLLGPDSSARLTCKGCGSGFLFCCGAQSPKKVVMKQKKPTKAHRARPRGRPKENVADKVDFERLERLMAMGLTDEQLAGVLQVDRSTVSRWKYDPEFLRHLKKGKSLANAKVERSLYARAVGLNAEEITLIRRRNKLIVKKIVTKYWPPDVAACMSWLTNRDKDNWKHRYALEGTPEHPIPFRLVADHDCDRD